MKSRYHPIAKICLLATASLSLVACEQAENLTGGDQSETPSVVSIDTVDQQISYALGASMAKQLEPTGFVLDKSAYWAAFDDIMSGNNPRLTDDEIQEVMSQFAERARQLAQERFDKLKAENKAKGEAYLAANAEKDGVQVTASGLQYKVLDSGGGATPGATDQVTVHYHGTLIDGTVFDSSIDRGQPATFRLNQVIAGWTEVLQLMQVGDKFEVTIPSELAYGERSTGKIGPNSTLIFEIELLDIPA